ncbi:uncharacterized protein LOC108607166 isoform X2 [Drosophila busckii]|uniref:uncharacterized protein LOC108607166 isoform X2 n=1 Tax=Drosophila busckii TaxID=30019 RepID=UPI00083ED4BC|nr:uncharacterized protein LOC108607166 isoform X2 [Drosophila busckii]
MEPTATATPIEAAAAEPEQQAAEEPAAAEIAEIAESAGEPTKPLEQQIQQQQIAFRNRRNPITGDGINIYKLFQTRKPAGHTACNPLTGEGYPPERTDMEALQRVQML